MKKIDLEKLKEYYFEEKLSAKKTGNLLGVSESFVNKQIKNLGLKKRTNGESNRKFSEIRIFETIDTEQKAYWLGYLFADGCLYNKEHTVKGKKYFQAHISLTSIDKEIIDNFKKFMGCSTISKPKIVKKGLSLKKSIYYIANFSSLDLYNDLINKGMLEQKTYNLRPPKNIPDRLKRHFIRGYFDGDGSVYISKRGKNITITSQFIGSKDFCQWIRNELEFLPNNKGIYKEKRTKHDDLYYLRINKKNSKKFYQYIYKGATEYMNRKKNKFDNFFKEKGSTTIISES